MNNDGKVIFLTHKRSDAIRRAARKLVSESGGRRVTVLSQDEPLNVAGADESVFSADQLMRETSWPVIGNSITPGHAHFPVFNHILNNESSEPFYWIVEYDVRYTGAWSDFFNSFRDNDADFLTAHFRTLKDEPGWAWWEMKHPEKEILQEKRIRSFNPVNRISDRAVRFLDQEFSSGWSGHNEVIIPTLLAENGFTFSDIGENEYYTCYGDSNGKLLTGTFRHKPPMKRPGLLRNRLYHPVKKEGVGRLRNCTGSWYRTLKLRLKKS
jgi:hypothetical protein